MFIPNSTALQVEEYKVRAYRGNDDCLIFSKARQSFMDGGNSEKIKAKVLSATYELL